MATDLGEVIKHRISIIYILFHNPGLYQNMQILSGFIGRFPASMHIRMPRVEWFVF